MTYAILNHLNQAAGPTPNTHSASRLPGLCRSISDMLSLHIVGLVFFHVGAHLVVYTQIFSYVQF